MNSIAMKCLNGVHRRFVKDDDNPELEKLSAFVALLKGDYSGENIKSKIIDTDDYWNSLINTKGFGRGIKYKKAQDYRENLMEQWKIIEEVFNTQNEREISKLIGLLIWDIDVATFKHSYLGLIEVAIKLNLLWKNPMVSKIYCSYFGFIESESKTMNEIASENDFSKEGVRQLKEQTLNSFETDFWFLKDEIIKDKLKSYFSIDEPHTENISNQTIVANSSENVRFSREFYMYMLSVAFDLVLVGNINDIKSQNSSSTKRHIWKNLYLQTKEEHSRFKLETLVNTLAIEINNRNGFFKEDTIIDLLKFTSTELSFDEIEIYKKIIQNEISNKFELTSNTISIKRTSIITLPEMAENALKELGGFAYADDILNKVIQLYPEKNWTMPILKSSFRGDNFYSVGKNGLFGLLNIKDFRVEMGNGTLNDIIFKYMSGNESPAHIYELFLHVNKLFPRSKSINTIHTILSQNSKRYFIKFDGGYYGLQSKTYTNTKYQKTVGIHSTSLSQIIKKHNGISRYDIYKLIQSNFTLSEFQIKYLLHLLEENKKIILKSDLYYTNIPNFWDEDEVISLDIVDEEINITIDDEELNWEELYHPEVPNNLIYDSEAQIKIRRGQPKFRLKLLKFYNSTCIITGCTFPGLLEAAHVLPYSQKRDNNITNGLLLRTDIHTLFDLGLIAIDPESMLLKLSSTLIETEDYSKFDGMDIGSKLNQLHPNYTINQEGLKFRWKIFIDQQ